MRYLVILSLTEEDGTPDEPWERTSPKKVILCKDSKEVASAIHSTQAREGCIDDWDWCVFEVVGDKTEQRAVVFKTDGGVAYDCEVS